MRLSESHVRHFETFGFLLLPNLFSSSEMERLSADADRLFKTDCEEHQFTGKERQLIQGFVEQSTALSELIDDDRVFGTVSQLLASDIMWIGSDGNRYVGETGWHPDGSNLSCQRIKVLFYLDPLTVKTGALRVIPGSHRDPFHSILQALLQRHDATITPYGVRASVRTNPRESGYAVAPEKVPSYAVETMPGDVVFFDQNIWHASFGGRPGRRMFTLNYAKTPTTPPEWEFVEQMYRGQLDHVSHRQFRKQSYVYGEQLLTSKRPIVQTLVSPLVKRGFR